MDAEGRRRAIAAELARAGAPVSAAALAARLGVSRQVIVGDVALLRASGMEITATPRGYVAGGGARGRRHTLACVHGPEGMERELNIMVDNGCAFDQLAHHIYFDVSFVYPLNGNKCEFVIRSRSAFINTSLCFREPFTSGLNPSLFNAL